MKHAPQRAAGKTLSPVLLSASTLVAALGAALLLSGCVVVGGSSRGGLFLWPGGLGLGFIILLVLLLLRRR